MLRQRRPGGHAKHVEGRRERVARGAAREARASAAWQDGGRSTNDGGPAFRRGQPTVTGALGWRRLIGARDVIDARQTIGTIACADLRASITSQ